MTNDPIKTIVERIEAVEAKQTTLLASKRAEYARAKEAGFNTKALRKVIAERRIKDRDEIEADAQDYRIRLGMAVNAVANGASFREAAGKHGVAKSTVHLAVHRQEKTKAGQQVDGSAADVPRETKTETLLTDDCIQPSPGETRIGPPSDRVHAADPPEPKAEVGRPPATDQGAVPSEAKADDGMAIPWFLKGQRKDQVTL